MTFVSITKEWDREVVSHMVERGTLFLVVGPSGAGKDSLIDVARAHFRDDPEIVFPRRTVTRPAGSGGEDHESLDPELFEHRRAGGAFALSWEAHGLAYGIPRTIEHDLACGRSVVVNVSRAVIDEARERFSPVKVLSVRVPPEVLAARLTRRGRESALSVESRIARADAYRIVGDDVTVIDNARPLTEASREFISAIDAG